MIFSKRGIDRLEDGDVDNGHGAAGAAGPELFPERAVLARRNRRVIETRGIDRDLVPAMDRFLRDRFARRVGCVRRLSMKLWAVGLTEIARRSLGEGDGREGYEKQ